MAKSFSPSKDGIAQLMAQQGKSKRDLQNAIKMLDNPAIKSTIGKIPGLDNMLRGAVNDLTNDFSMDAKNSASGDLSFTPQNSGGGNDGVSSLMARLKRLK